MGTEEGVSETCSCVRLKLDKTNPKAASTGEVTELGCGRAGAAAGCRGGWLEWIEAGAVLGPASIWAWFFLSSEKACWRLMGPADGDNCKLGAGG